MHPPQQGMCPGFKGESFVKCLPAPTVACTPCTCSSCFSELLPVCLWFCFQGKSLLKKAFHRDGKENTTIQWIGADSSQFVDRVWAALVCEHEARQRRTVDIDHRGDTRQRVDRNGCAVRLMVCYDKLPTRERSSAWSKDSFACLVVMLEWWSCKCGAGTIHFIVRTPSEQT